MFGSVRERSSKGHAAADERQPFAVSAHQALAARNPQERTQALIGRAAADGGDPPGLPFLGRPYAVWRRRPELAFEINERLSQNAG